MCLMSGVWVQLGRFLLRKCSKVRLPSALLPIRCTFRTRAEHAAGEDCAEMVAAGIGWFYRMAQLIKIITVKHIAHFLQPEKHSFWMQYVWWWQCECANHLVFQISDNKKSHLFSGGIFRVNGGDEGNWTRLGALHHHFIVQFYLWFGRFCCTFPDGWLRVIFMIW